jgi:hypothetical protein
MWRCSTVVMGGLGNKLFQLANMYAFAHNHNLRTALHRNMTLNNHQTFADWSYFHRGTPIEDFHYTTVAELADHPCVYRDYSASVPRNADFLFYGYFQSEKFFENCKQLIYDQFRCPDHTREKLLALYPDVESNGTFIHIRMGDYVNNPHHFIDLRGFMQRNVRKYFSSDHHYYLFTDSPDLVRKNQDWLRDLSNVTFVSGLDEVETLWLMSLCGHGGIASNSSYSWWGGWLGKQRFGDASTVVYPDRQFPKTTSMRSDDLVPACFVKERALLRCGVYNGAESTCCTSHEAACMEFLQGFSTFGYDRPLCIRNEHEVANFELIILSNVNVSVSFMERLNRINPDAIYILWFYFEYVGRIPFAKFIYTSEHWLHKPTLQPHANYWEIAQTLNNYVPMLLRAPEDPEKIGTYQRSEVLNGCYMGSNHRPDWVQGLGNIVYHNAYQNGYLSYAQRRDIYLRSKIAFGFQMDDNCKNFHVTQRVFEGLANGCLVLCESIAASEMTGGVVEYVADKADFLRKYDYFLAHPEERLRRIETGYEYARRFGTNRYSASLFMKKFMELGYM